MWLLRGLRRCFLCVEIIDKFLFSFFVHFVYISIFSLCSALFFFSFFSFFFLFFTYCTYLPPPPFSTIIIIRKKRKNTSDAFIAHTCLVSARRSASFLPSKHLTPPSPHPPLPHPFPTNSLPFSSSSLLYPTSLSLSSSSSSFSPASTIIILQKPPPHSFIFPLPHFPTYLPSNPPSIPSQTPSSHPSPPLRDPAKPPSLPLLSLSDTEPSLLKERSDMSYKRYRWIIFGFSGCWVCVILWFFLKEERWGGMGWDGREDGVLVEGEDGGGDGYQLRS